MKKRKYVDHVHKLYSGAVHLSKNNLIFGRDVDRELVIETHHGFVVASIFNSVSKGEKTCLKFIWKGKIYRRTYQKIYTSRGAVTKAKIFVGEVTRGNIRNK